ncbi:MAG TPA: hypothetical protein VGQ55_03705, partial [Pyrinomonadaceae bacterium]|nr:hypothetical protein [Pyrinomonadaceae bacterium]
MQITINLKDVVRFAIRLVVALAVAAAIVYAYRFLPSLTGSRGTLYGTWLQFKAYVWRADRIWDAIIVGSVALIVAGFQWPN